MGIGLHDALAEVNGGAPRPGSQARPRDDAASEPPVSPRH